MRQAPVARRERGRVAALVQSILHQARRQPGWQEPDRRNTRTWRHFVLGIVVARSPRLVAVSQVLFGQRAAQSVKAVAMGLAYFLAVADFPAATLSPLVLEAAVRQLDPAQVATYRGKAVLVLDPTEYAKRSRGRGRSKDGTPRFMEHIGRVRKPQKGAKPTRKAKRTGASQTTAAAPATKAPRVATTTGYVDVWAGLVLTGKQFLPLARHLFSNAHPDLAGQNRVEEAVLAAALTVLERLSWAAIVVADRGLGRKELLVALVHQRRDLAIRVDPDITVYTADRPAGPLLADVLAAQPDRGEVIWDRGQEGTLRFVQLVPDDGPTAPLVLATTLPVATLADVKGVVRVYSWRWAIETGFETMKGWGLGRFMVRAWQAIDRLLWLVAVAYALLVVALRAPPLALLREQASRLLKRWAVLGRHLTVGKLAEAIGLDFSRHRRAWASVWLT